MRIEQDRSLTPEEVIRTLRDVFERKGYTAQREGYQLTVSNEESTACINVSSLPDRVLGRVLKLPHSQLVIEAEGAVEEVMRIVQLALLRGGG